MKPKYRKPPADCAATRTAYPAAGAREGCGWLRETGIIGCSREPEVVDRDEKESPQ